MFLWSMKKDVGYYQLCRRLYATIKYSGKGRPCLGIRRETINAWERRAPLAPVHVKKLTTNGVKVLIQPSNRRAYPIQEYIAAGGIVQENLKEAQLIISVKQVPIDQLIPEKTYAFFSHTIKAQEDNMEMLDTVLHRKIRLLDYEAIRDKNGQRLVMFGKWAGYAGLTNILHGLGLRLLALGHHTPFLHIGLAHNYRDSHMAINAIRDAGYEIALSNMPRSLGPLIFVFTGTGNVSQGAQELFAHLPHEFVDVAALPKVAQKGLINKVYGCVVGRHDHLFTKDGKPFDEESFLKYPETYISKFATEIAPYASVIINGIYWGIKTPRLITIPDAKYLLTPKSSKYDAPGCPTLPHRLIAICDISADPGGSIEFMNECTTIDKPFTIYDADMHRYSDSFDAPSGCLVCSIDNMPAQMPFEATEQFGDLLFPYIIDMLNCATYLPFENLNCREEIKRAIITDNGKLTPNFSYIEELRRQGKSAHKRPIVKPVDKRILLLGAGMVSGPFVSYFARKEHISLTVLSEKRKDGQRLAGFGPNIDAEVVDVMHDQEQLEQLISKHDLCVSLLPYTFHPMIAKICIRRRKNMVTTSYLSTELQSMNEDAVNAGITVMNECGLDPGIDHMLAMDCFDRVREHGGKVISFESFCGGLPAPESSDNPLRYKFSWSPKGTFLALMNPAKYLKDGRLVEVEGDCGVLNHLYPIRFMPGLNLIGYPNRDSTKYAEVYGLSSECKTLIRGTLRYKGFVEAVKALKTVGLLDTKPSQIFNSTTGPDLTWKEIMASLMHQPSDIFPDSLKNVMSEKLGFQRDKELLALETMRLFTDLTVERRSTPIDTLAYHLANEFSYQPHERDLIILNHDIGVRLLNGMKQLHRITCVAYGIPNGFSAMSQTVGYTCAIVSEMLLNGEIQRKGMIRPVSKDVYRSVLLRLKDFHIVADESVVSI